MLWEASRPGQCSAAFRARTGDAPDFEAALPAELLRHRFPGRAASLARRPSGGGKERRLRGEGVPRSLIIAYVEL